MPYSTIGLHSWGIRDGRRFKYRKSHPTGKAINPGYFRPVDGKTTCINVEEAIKLLPVDDRLQESKVSDARQPKPKTSKDYYDRTTFDIYFDSYVQFYAEQVGLTSCRYCGQTIKKGSNFCCHGGENLGGYFPYGKSPSNNQVSACENGIFDSVQSLRQDGYFGFKTVRELRESCSTVPGEPGIYMVLYLDDRYPKFVPVGTGGSHHGRNPNVDILELKRSWVEDAFVLYIGKAESLKHRINQYMGFGKGMAAPHHGGRYIWQIASCSDLVICWKLQSDRSIPLAEVEHDLLMNFKRKYKKLPFANLRE